MGAALLASGCGTGADSREVRGATQRFFAATRQHDGRTACAQLSSALRRQLVADEGVPTCSEAVVHAGLRGTRTAAVRVYATSAEVTLAGGDAVFLGATSRGWRIEAVGCRPAGEGPYDCDEQA